MNILDENLPYRQLELLRAWRVHARQIGHDIGRKGMQDDEIIAYLRTLRRATFFTRDLDYYKPNLCHSAYCLVYLSVVPSEVGLLVRRLLHHREFNTQAKRMGAVIRVAQPGLTVWRLHAEEAVDVPWFE